MTQIHQHMESQIAKTVRLDYLLHTPSSYDDRQTTLWPLILFLHGAGERGRDLDQVARHGIPLVALRQPDLLPFVAVSPQCPADMVWDDLVDELLALLDGVTSRMGIDRDRVYLTGLTPIRRFSRLFAG